MFYLLFTTIYVSRMTVFCNYNETYDIKSQTVTESKTAVFNCPLLKNMNNTAITWSFDNVSMPVFSVTENISDTSNRIRIGKNGSLVISNVKLSDAKDYTCTVNNKTIFNFQLKIKALPHKIYNFTLEFLSDTSLKLSWDIKYSPFRPVNTLNLTLCRRMLVGNCTMVNISYPAYSYTFNKLKSYTEYLVSIIAINNNGVSEESFLNATTLPGFPNFLPYISKKVASSRNVSLTIVCTNCMNKEKEQGVLHSYFISCTENSSVTNLTVPFNNNISEIQTTITNLLPYRNYSCFVSAFNGFKYGQRNYVYFQTKEDFPPHPPMVRAFYNSPNVIEVKWLTASDSFGPVTGYIIEVYDSNKESLLTSEQLARENNSFVIRNLKNQSPDLIKLWTINSVGRSKEYASYNIIKPNKPVILFVKNLESSLCVIFHFKEHDTESFSYKICFDYGNKSKVPDCHDIYPKTKIDSNHKVCLQCHCLLNDTVYWVNFPLKLIRLPFLKTEVMLFIKVTPHNKFCDSANECKFSGSTSDMKNITINDFYNIKNSKRRFYFLIWVVLGIVLILLLSFLVGWIMWKSNVKYFYFSTRQTMHYSRSPQEYLDICMKQQSILPLEKCPYPFINISNLVEHIQKYRADDGAGFQAEFEAIENMDNSKWNFTQALIKENKGKNRYTNIFPYDHSRVILQNFLHGKFDYINASFIDGFQRQKAYIATQGPLNETIDDFWQMVWEQNSEIIVMISNFVERGRSKCEMYWSSKKIVHYGNISVLQIFHNEMAYYTERRFVIRNIRIKKNSKQRIVYHYQYTDWSDFDVPRSALPVLVFLRASTKHWTENSGPIIVHCSAGVGRTGTYICIESQIRQLEIEKQVNVRGFLEHIRQQRMKLVQTESQYAFIHDVLYEYFLHPDREIHKHELSSYIVELNQVDSSGCKKLEAQFKKCIAFEPTDYDYIESKKNCNLSKNRSDIMPIESRRINLSSEPGVEGSNYINASAIQGYWRMKEFIITQHPLEETEQDFWKMVWDQNCTLIVLLSKQGLHQFWPGQDDNTRDFRWINVTHTNSEETEFSLKYSFLISSSREDYALDCNMHCLKRWPDTVSQCGELLRLLFEINSWKFDGPVVVIDDCGSVRAGIFVAMSSLLHQLRTNDTVNVYFVLKMIHIERPYTFSSSDELLFIYELLEFVILNQNMYSFFSNSRPDFIQNGDVSHLLQTDNKPLLNHNNTSSINNHCLTHRSKSTLSSPNRRQSVDSEPCRLQTPSPNLKNEYFGNRISWNPGENVREKPNPLLSGSLLEWPNSTCNNHSSSDHSTNTSLEIPELNNLPVAKIVPYQSDSQIVQSPSFNFEEDIVI